MKAAETELRQVAESQKPILEDYECKKNCMNCPFPGAKCYQTKYDRYHTNLLIRKSQGETNGTKIAE